MLLFLLLLMLCFGIVFFVLRPTKTQTAVQQHLENIQESRAEESGRTILKRKDIAENQELAQFIRQIPGALGTLNLLRQSGQKWMVVRSWEFRWLRRFLLPGFRHIFCPDRPLPYWPAWPQDRFPMFISSSCASSAFANATSCCRKQLISWREVCGRDTRSRRRWRWSRMKLPNPSLPNSDDCMKSTQLGLPLREATMNLVDRLPRDDMRFLATAILLQKETGGNLAIILDKTAAVARERSRLRGQLRIYTAQGRVTGWVLCMMPFIMFGLLSAINWQFEKLLFTEHMGRVMVYFGLALMLAGVLVIRKIIDVKV